jgi:hypothetical protein
MILAPVSVEEAVIEEAYKDQVGLLFRMLCANLEGGARESETPAQRFRAGLVFAKQAKQMALNILHEGGA